MAAAEVKLLWVVCITLLVWVLGPRCVGACLRCWWVLVWVLGSISRVPAYTAGLFGFLLLTRDPLRCLFTPESGSRLQEAGDAGGGSGEGGGRAGI